MLLNNYYPQIVFIINYSICSGNVNKNDYISLLLFVFLFKVNALSLKKIFLIKLNLFITYKIVKSKVSAATRGKLKLLFAIKYITSKDKKVRKVYFRTS